MMMHLAWVPIVFLVGFGAGFATNNCGDFGMSDTAVMLWIMLPGIAIVAALLFWFVGRGKPDDGTD